MFPSDMLLCLLLLVQKKAVRNRIQSLKGLVTAVTGFGNRNQMIGYKPV
jgi:hypothetical protein